MINTLLYDLNSFILIINELKLTKKMEYLDIKDNEKLIKFFQELGIISKMTPLCRKCSVDMKFCAKKDNIDKFAWRCTKNGCGSSQSIRKGSFLEGFHKDLYTF